MHSLPDMNELAKIAASPAGQKILAIVQHSNDLDLDKLALLSILLCIGSQMLL